MNRFEIFTALSDLSEAIDSLSAELRQVFPLMEDVLVSRRDRPPTSIPARDLLVSLTERLAGWLNSMLPIYDQLREYVGLEPLHEVCQMGIDACWVTAAWFWRERLRELDPSFFSGPNP